MTAGFRTMTQDQRDMLSAVEGKITSKQLAEHFSGRFGRPRVQGLLNSLKFRGLVENVSGTWFRTDAGNTIAEKLADGTYGRVVFEVKKRDTNR